MDVCPNCQQNQFDITLGVCRACGALATSDPTVHDGALMGLLHNLRIRITDLRPHEFQQVLGLFGPRIGHSEDDGIPFSAETCAMTHRYLREHGIQHCVRLAVTANARTEHSLVVALSETGIERCLRMARKATQRQRARLQVITDP